MPIRKKKKALLKFPIQKRIIFCKVKVIKEWCALKEEGMFKKYIIVSLEDFPRITDGIHIKHWKEFLEELWQDSYI